jgi:hypothetical protein
MWSETYLKYFDILQDTIRENYENFTLFLVQKW